VARSNASVWPGHFVISLLERGVERTAHNPDRSAATNNRRNGILPLCDRMCAGHGHRRALRGVTTLCEVVDYRIDDLARTAGTTVRNVRVYQDRDLLPPPRKEGRTAIYSDAHLTRLKLIISMLERGYAFAQIKEMLGAWESGRSLGEVLGLEEAVADRTWAMEEPRSVTLGELRKKFGSQVTPSAIKRVIALGILERRGRGFVTTSPLLYDAAAEMVALGIPLDDTLTIAEDMLRKVDGLGDDLADLVRRHVVTRVSTVEEATPFYSDVIDRLRPLVFNALQAAAIRSAERLIPAVVGERMADVMAQGSVPQGSREAAKS
jgi:DNA-binding transcriptional MerR regulator